MCRGMRLLEKAVEILALFCVLLLLFPLLFRLYPKIVLSGSMEPEIPVGSLAYIYAGTPAEEIRARDVIAYEIVNGTSVLHRVTGINSQKAEFRTKGDANEAADMGAVSFEQYQGKYMFCVPFVGYLVYFLKNKIVIAVMLLLYIANMVIYKLLESNRKGENIGEKQ